MTSVRPRSFVALFCAGLLFVATAAWAVVPVGADHANLQYTGRIDFADRTAPVLSWPGTSIEGNFTGTSLAIKLDDKYGKNWFNVFIDGNLAKPVVIGAAKGGKTYAVATGLPAGPQLRRTASPRTGAQRNFGDVRMSWACLVG